MDYIGILKEAWEVTWRHRALWILGLFTAGSGGVSMGNWQTNTQEFQNQPTTGEWKGFERLGPEFERAGEEIANAFSEAHVAEWLPWVLLGVGVLLLIGFGLWVLSVAAKGGLIQQTGEALSGREVSVRAGWREGFRKWGRVFLVGFVLVLPQLAVGAVATGVLALAVVAGSTVPGGGPGALGLLALLPLALLVVIALSVLMAMLHEVALRYAVLADEVTLDAIKRAWADLWGKRGVMGMWLVMLLVGIGAGVAGAIIIVPLAVTIALIAGGAALAGGPAALWVLLPLGLLLLAVGMLIKAVYQTFAQTAWTSFYLRMRSEGDPQPERVAVPEPEFEYEPATETPESAEGTDAA